MQFLMGLNECYNVVRGNVLMMRPFATLPDVFQILLQEKKQREVCNKSHISHETSTFYTNMNNFNGRGIRVFGRGRGGYNNVSYEAGRNMSNLFFCCTSWDKNLNEDQFEKLVQMLNASNVSAANNASADSHGFMTGKIASTFYDKLGILHQSSCVHTPQQNGVVERKHKHLLETIRALLFQSNLAIIFWIDCILTAIYLINSLPTDSPLPIIPNEFPTSMYYPSFIMPPVHVTDSDHQHRFSKIIDPPSNHVQHLKSPASNADHISHEQSSAHTHDNATTSKNTPCTSLNDPVPLRSSTRVHNAPKDLTDYVCYGVQSSFGAKLNTDLSCITNKPFVSSISSIIEPKIYKQAIKDSQWIYAMNKELDVLSSNGTWDIMHLPVGKRVISCKWIYKIKLKLDESIEMYKARLVAKGLTQQHGIDYTETFSPVVKMSTVSCILTIDVSFGWPFFQLDVNNSFLYGDLVKEVYMQPPQGVTVPSGLVYMLKKSLYGLKQASRQWFSKLSHTLLTMGYQQSKNDYSLYVMHNDEDTVIVAIYVDDILLTGSNAKAIADLKAYLHQQFTIKDLGLLHYFLGFEIVRSADQIVMTRCKFVNELLAYSGIDFSVTGHMHSTTIECQAGS
ncbi:transmembrane signal receptor [Lithospermum erythrorhizon]|uniref:Transmembrane signal receptor n=1 Tax=Lithospermum erythrorhizon TaxID=34254 RepID=A0AAV3NJF4_LITER